MYRLELKNIMTAVMFAYSDPISVKEMKDVIDVDLDPRLIESLMDELKLEYEEKKFGIQILKFDGRYQMSSNTLYNEYIRKLFEPKKKKSLTQAALETLTIIAYKQPITKVEIEEIRGVKCDKAISTLIESELIYEAGRLNRIGKPIIYKQQKNF